MQTLAAIMVVILLAFGLFYIASDPFQGSVDESVRQLTTWTPERIRDDKSGYVRWAIGECRKRRAALEAMRIHLRMTRGRAERSAGEMVALQERLDGLLRDLENAYRESDGTWPVDVRGFTFDEDELRNAILSGRRRRERDVKRIARNRNTVVTITNRLEQVDDAVRKADDLLVHLRDTLDAVRLEETKDDLRELYTTVNELRDMPAALEEDAAVPSVEDMIGGSSDADFEAIMGMDREDGR